MGREIYTFITNNAGKYLSIELSKFYLCFERERFTIKTIMTISSIRMSAPPAPAAIAMICVEDKANFSVFMSQNSPLYA